MRSRDICNLPHKSPNLHAVLEKEDPEILHTCRAFCECFFRFFFPDIWVFIKIEKRQLFVLFLYLGLKRSHICSEKQRQQQQHS